MLSVFACFVIAPPISAQTLRGKITSNGSQTPIPSAVISIESSQGTPLARTLSNVSGDYALKVPDGASRIRVLRIGFAPKQIALSSADTGIVRLDVSLDALRTMLQTVEIKSQSACKPQPDRAAALALFEQARLGFLATVVAREASPAQVKVLRYQRYLRDSSDDITSQDVWIESISSQSRPFFSYRSAAELVQHGFVSDDKTDKTFFAPDADVMLEDAFRSGYCFALQPGREAAPSEIGLSFSASAKRKGKVDIDGTVWIDTAARALRAIDFRYVGLDERQQYFRPGGHVEFREMPNGSTLVDRWHLRLVALSADTVRAGVRRIRLVSLFEIQESGGELANVNWNSGATWRASLGALHLSARGQDGSPVKSTQFFLENTGYRFVTNDSGFATVNDLLPGPYRAAVVDPELAKISVYLYARLAFDAVRDSVLEASVQVPTALEYAEDLCKAEPTTPFLERYDPERDAIDELPRQQGRGATFFVYVVDSAGTPLDNVAVTESVLSPERPARYRSKAFGSKTESDGRYFSCWNFFVGESVQIWVKPNRKDPYLTEVTLTNKVNAIRIVVPTGKQ